MSASFYDLLKYAATGIPAPNMTAWDKARALAIGGGSKEQTLTGIPPLSFKSDGSPLISWSMKGNGSQSGTPTPDNPVMPEFVGVRTANLFDKNSDTINNNGQSRPGVKVQPGTYSIDNTTDRAVYYRIGYGGTTTQVNAGRKSENVIASDDLYVWRDNGVRQDGIMLNSGSTAKPYEPFGYKIPITCAGQTVPVYLGEVPTVRRVKKLVLTGAESWINNSNKACCVLYLADEGYYTSYNSLIICTHMEIASHQGILYNKLVDYGITFGGNSADRICIRNKDCEPVADFKAWLASEYAAGHPVTVWYVLATPTTGIVNEPLCKIGDYADELSSTDAAVTIPTAKGSNTLTADTPIPPSEMSITYRG